MNKIKDKWSALSMQQRADLIKLYINSGITNINDIRKHYNSFDYGGDISWEDVDKFVEKAEPWVSGTSLATTGTALAISAASGGTAAPVALPVATTISTILNGAGVLIDGYQAVRDFQNGNYGSGAWNSVEAITGVFGAKAASKLSRTAGGRAIGKFKEQLVKDRFATSGDKITRLMRKGLTYEEAAERVLQNAINYVDNSSKVKDTATGIRKYYEDKFKKGANVVDTVFDTIDVGKGISSRFKDEPPIEIYKNGGKLNSFATGGPIEETLDLNTNEPLITREEYLNRQRQAIINQSIENSNNREMPTVPYILEYANEDEWKQFLTKELIAVEQGLKDAIEYNWDTSYVDMYKSSISSINEKLQQGYKHECVPGASCIYTATDNYGKKYRVSGNRSFRSSPEKYGFTEINLNDIKPGDIIQDFSVDGNPTHALTFMGYNDGGTALYNYSSGDHTKEAIRKNKKYPFYTIYGDELHLNNEDNADLRTYAAAYRFIGNNEDNNLWNQEYNDYRSDYTRNIVNQLKSVQKLPQPNVRQLSSLGIERKNGGKVNRFDEGGKIDIKYPLDATTGNGEKYSDIIMQREHDAYNALLRNGYSIEDARRLSPILTAQSLYETGWRLSDKNNNYAGYLDSKGNKLKYDSAEGFWDSHLKNLSNRWSNWDTAQNVEDYYNIVNQTHLNLKSKEDYNRYKKDNPNTFIYSPTWENTDYKRRLLSTSARVQSYLDRLSMNKDFPLNNDIQPFIDKSLFPVEFLYK